jgi:dTDP-4-amino-4,6-dideoxy-D-galactose acyltransferase
MPTLAEPATTKLLSSLEWDSRHFGFPVGRVAAGATDDELHAALEQARHGQYRLIYWATSPDRASPPELLAAFDGRLVDRKVTFSRSLSDGGSPPGRSSETTIVPFAEQETSAELAALAIAAGAYSRFAVDVRIPRAQFEQLYRIWIERSVRGEIADVVLAARGNATEATLAGMVTVKVANGIGNIGLVAVAKSHRGRGIGSRLIDGAHRWMAGRGAVQATVVTQAANRPACRLYERAGYTVARAENYYHFWP